MLGICKVSLTVPQWVTCRWAVGNLNTMRGGVHADLPGAGHILPCQLKFVEVGFMPKASTQQKSMYLYCHQVS